MSAAPDLFQTTQCLCLASRRAARAITRRYDNALRAHGLRATQFSLLSGLALKGPLPIGALASLLGADRTTLTRNLAVAEARGLVAVAPGEDARARIASLTAEGRRVLESAYAAWRAVQEGLTGDIGNDGADSLRRLSGGPSVLLAAAAP